MISIYIYIIYIYIMIYTVYIISIFAPRQPLPICYSTMTLIYPWIHGINLVYSGPWKLQAPSGPIFWPTSQGTDGWSLSWINKCVHESNTCIGRRFNLPSIMAFVFFQIIVVQPFARCLYACMLHACIYDACNIMRY